MAAAVPAAAAPGIQIPPEGEPRWQFSVKPPVKDTVTPFEADFGFRPDLTSKQIEISPWALDLDSRFIARADSLDLETYRSFRELDRVKNGWNSKVNALLGKTELQRRGELRIGLALPSAVESIVGEGGAGLKVSGYRKILFSGRSQWTDKASTATVRQSKFPSLSMEQISKFTVEGTIGSKISVKVDQDSKRTSDLENRIIIRYKGDEDDILQSVDLGNTTLSLSDARFIGYSQRIQGLFGISATGKMGPVDFKVIASQEKGNTTSSRLIAGANEQNIIIRDYAYDRFRFFDLGLMGDTSVLAPGDSIIEFDLFQSVSSNQNDVPFARAHHNWLDPEGAHPIEARFRQVSFADPVEYALYRKAHYLRFPRRLSQIDNTALAYFMRYLTASGDTVTVGSYAGDTLDLQVLKVHYPSPTAPLWEAEWRNVYDLRIRDIEYEDLDLNIYKGLLGDEENPSNLDHQNSTPYLRIFDLDKTNASGSGFPDNKIDHNEAILDLTEGLLVFPNRRPFVDTEGLSEAEVVPEIYTDNNTEKLREVTKYYIKITTRKRSRELRLGVVNILEGSEVVTFNNNRLHRGSDYDIDYDLGTVTFRRDDILDPNASVTVDYEYAPFMTVEKRSLFGFSTTYDGGDNLRAGATLLYKGTKATDRPAQLGQEPFRDIVGEVFLNWHADAPFLTGIVDALPLIATQTPSSLDFQGAVAQSFPNPNTKGVVYVDDFQGARRAQSLGILRETWTLASPPLAESEFGTDQFRSDRGAASEGAFTGLSDPAVIWTNPYPQFLDTAIYVRDPDRSDGRQRNTHVFIMEFRPHQSPTIAADGVPGDAWGGVMNALAVHLWDQSRAEFIELRMAVVSRATGAERKGTLHLDLGRVSEDVNGDGTFNTEDQEIDGIRNQILDEGEDLGLDGLPDEEEIGPWGDPWDVQTNPDPARDNWPDETSDATALSRHDRINGTQNNERDPVRGLRPDSEDIGGPSEFDRVNAYYEFSIDLGDPLDPSLVPESGKRSVDRSGYTAEGLTWQTYRIPLWDNDYYERFFESGSLPDSSNAIEFARLWIDGADTTVRIYIASIDIVARTWTADLAKADPIDSTGAFRLGVVNDEENVDYVSPPGVSGYEDPRSDFTETEQALLLEWEDLSPGDVGSASIKGLAKEDYTGYRTMRMWVWADSLADSLADIALRFGQDTNNYYFYQKTLAYDPVHDNNWEANRIVIDFNDLTALKYSNEGRDSVFDSVSHIGFKGRPSLTNVIVKEIVIIPHGTSNASAYSGKVWCNELELVDPRKDAGIAASGKLTAQVADLVGFTAAIEGRNYSFRGLTAGRTSSLVGGSSQLRTSFNGNLNLHKFLPEKLGISLPFAANYTRSDATPRLLTGSDVVIPVDLLDRERSTTITHGFSTRFAMRPKEAGWLVRSTIAGFSTRFAGSRARAWTPTTPESEKENYTASADYKLQIGAPLTFPALYWTRYLLFPQRIWRTPFSPLPTDFNASGTVRRQRSLTLNNRWLPTRSYTRDLVGTAGIGLKPIPAVQVNYNMSTTRDLADPKLLVISTNPRDFRLGRETAYSQRLQSSYRPSLFSFFSPTFTYNATFRDNIDRQYGDHDVNVDRNWSVSGSFDPAKFWSALGAKAGRGGPRARGGDQLPERYRQQQEVPDTDTTAAKEEKSKGGGGLGLGLGSAWRVMMNGMKWLTSPFGTLSVNYTRGDGDVRRDLRVRPSRLYQFGFDLDEEVAAAGSAANSSLAQQSSRSQRENINVKNTIDFLGILSFSNTYTRTNTKNTTAGSASRKEGEVFPSLATSLNRLERLKPLGWVFSSASVRFAYTRKTDFTFVGGKRNNKVTGENFSPLFSLRGTTRKGIQLDIVIDRTSTVSQPRIGNSTKSLTRQVRVTSSFSFASPNGLPIPFLRKLRFKSRLSLSITVTHRVTETFMALRDSTGADLDFGEPTQSNADLSITLNGNYSFSTRVRGGLKLEWIDRTSRQVSGSQKSHVRVVSIWAEFSF